MVEQQDANERDPFQALLAGVREFARTSDDETGREVLIAAVKQFLAELSDEQFAAFVEEVREPDQNDDETTDSAYPDNWGFQPSKA
jgi:hypothetical protein